MKDVAKIVSMKEDLDAVSWSRVVEIAKMLQDGSGDEAGQELGRELLAIAQANTSLLGKFGTSLAGSGRVMPSGIEILGDSSVLSKDEVPAMATPSEQSAALIEIADEIEEVRLPEAFNLYSSASETAQTQPIVVPPVSETPVADGPTATPVTEAQPAPPAADEPTVTPAADEPTAASAVEPQPAAPATEPQPATPATEAQSATPAPSEQVDVEELVRVFRSKVASSTAGAVADPPPVEEEDLAPVTISTIAASASVIAEPLEPEPSLSEAVNQASPFFIIDAATEEFIPRGENAEERPAEKPVLTPLTLDVPVVAEGGAASAKQEYAELAADVAQRVDPARPGGSDAAFDKAIADALKQGIVGGQGVRSEERPDQVPVQRPVQASAPAPAMRPVQASTQPPVQAESQAQAQAVADAAQTPRQTVVEQASGPTEAVSEQTQAPHTGKTLKSQDFARFRQLYSSKDGNLCVYEDSFGHLVAVDASKFA